MDLPLDAEYVSQSIKKQHHSFNKNKQNKTHNCTQPTNQTTLTADM